ncbi:MAG TPA: antibiotic biosynthesis monooxygenase [Deltaproteobacteria bacterium]|nr:antibiotic biosynthesis monooxygenase [Deltaproteobacteria bacterium]
MIVVVAVMKVKEGKEQEMEDALKNIVPKVASEEGTLAYVINQAKKDPRTFLIYEKYRDKDALNLHSSTPYFADLFEKISPILDGAPSIDIYKELSSI